VLLGCGVTLLLPAEVFCDGDELGNADGASDGELTRLGSFKFDPGDPDGCVVGTSVFLSPVLGALLGLEEDITVDVSSTDGCMVGSSVALSPVLGALLGLEDMRGDVGSTVAVGTCVGGGSSIPIPKLEHSEGTPAQETNTGLGHARSSISALAQVNEESGRYWEGQTGRVFLTST
jgi:hypothetical protein